MGLVFKIFLFFGKISASCPYKLCPHSKKRKKERSEVIGYSADRSKRISRLPAAFSFLTRPVRLAQTEIVFLDDFCETPIIMCLAE